MIMSAEFTKRIFTDASGGRLPYRLLIPPERAPGQRWPAILFLHGSGERGNDNSAQLANVGARFLEPDFLANWPACVIFPQCPEHDDWAHMKWDTLAGDRAPEFSSATRRTLALVDSLVEEFDLDADRVYLAGLSMGGFGVWDIITRQPGKFAAAIPVCGGGDEKTVTREVARVPVWAFHSDDDGAVNVVRTRNMVAAMRAQGGQPRYTEYRGIGHNSWDAAFAEPEIFPWLFAQRLGQ
jgi:predicted peptidase